MAGLESIPEKLIVAFVVILISFLQLTTNFYVLGPALGGWTTLFAQKLLAPMNILLISLYVNYYLACTTDPGTIPEGWEPPSSVLDPDESVPIQVGITGPRFCKQCNCYKPPRSHHCKQCRKCILRMDHHCPWLGNCIGFGNYSYFVRFVFSVMTCCSYGGYLLLWRLQRILDMRKSVWYASQVSTAELMVIAIDLTLIVIILILVGVLAVYHTYCLLKGQTTIEGWERTKTTRLVNRRKIDPVEFPFDVGFYHNICSVLGYNPLLWCFPLPSPGDGLKYPVKPNTDPLLPYSWPPRDPKDLGPSIIERVEQEHKWDGPKLVRRDSEGYLVKEITMEDRMKMLYAENLEEEQIVMELNPEEYYYDSNTSDITDYELSDRDEWQDED
ncbi:hypothetical protein INT47_008715 [Mucor saturninus]|uniref:Palmitoyltransferase n=1 Tax=Mucor saturninus TaxID=64648 RepID=A0A8H7RL26_9FUNG|nr:hypothetical protein INT47_008715 [Mucor saturninus]